MQHFFLWKSKKIFFSHLQSYKKHKTIFTTPVQKEIEETLVLLQKALQEKQRSEASTLAKKLLSYKALQEKTSFEKIKDLTFAIAVALVFATLVRQMWFEFYTIPSGSMRPTLKENDYLVVSKTDFGINTPGRTSHFYFDPTLVKRGGIVIFSGEGMDIQDVDTTYFYLFPGKKQYIKRLIGKPGDKIYFYGGQLYGLDKDGQTIDYQAPWFLEHIPFLRLEGRAFPSSNAVYLSHFNEPLVKMSATHSDILSTSLTEKTPPSYKDFWGIKNFAMVKLLTKDKFPSFLPQEPAYYLELQHDPELTPSFSLSTSFIPLTQQEASLLFSHLSTSRFIVKDHIGYRFGSRPTPHAPHLSNVPDGTYEFDNGKAFAVKPLGILKELPLSHPLYQHLPLLFNIGIEWDTAYVEKNFPSRYGYFRSGEFFIFGTPLLKNKFFPFNTFKDLGAPSPEDIQNYGLKVPSGYYLVLGDNHPMSSDSRIFGFVPEKNLRGGASFIFWPPGSRLGHPFGPYYEHLTFSSLCIYFLTLISLLGYKLYERYKLKRPIKF